MDLARSVSPVPPRPSLDETSMPPTSPPQSQSQSVPTPSSSPEPPLPSTSTPVPDALRDFSFNNAAASSSSDGSLDHNRRLSSPVSPGTTTKGAFFRSRSKSRERPNRQPPPSKWEHGDDSSIEARSRSPSSPGRRSRPTSPLAPGNSRAGSSRHHKPPLPSLAKAIYASDQLDPRGGPATGSSNPRSGSSMTWTNARSNINVKDDLLMSLLASQAMVDSRESEILTAEDVEDLKRVCV